MEKSDFWDLKRLNFLWPKKVSFRSGTLLNIISSLILTEDNSRKKTTFFDQKHGLTPLEKCDFWDFQRGVCKTRNLPGTYRNLPEPTGTCQNQPEPTGTCRNHAEPTRNPPETKIIKIK